MPRREKENDPEVMARREENKRTIRDGKYLAWRFPMLEANPDIDPGQLWEEGRPLPEGFRLDKSSRIWPVAVKRGAVPPDHARCTGTDRTGGRCVNWRKKGFEVCRMHGGGVAQGVDSPNTITAEHTRHGLFGEVFPAELSKFFENAINSPELTNLSGNIATLTARECQLKEGLSTGESRAEWVACCSLVEKLYAAARDRDTEEMNKIFPKLRHVTRAGRSDTLIWKEIGEIGERKRRLIETERKRRLDMNRVISADKLRNVLSVFTKIVFIVLDGIPSICARLIEDNGCLDTALLANGLKALIGRRITTACEGMKAGTFADELTTI